VVALLLFLVVDAVEADRDADHQRVVLARSAPGITRRCLSATQSLIT
jgi:hypothetical protein